MFDRVLDISLSASHGDPVRIKSGFQSQSFVYIPVAYSKYFETPKMEPLQK